MPPRKGFRGTPEERFWCKVVRSSGCWQWKGGRFKKGYGIFWDGEKNMLAHRFSWELHYGPIPDGLNVLHQCDNPPCIRPDHLFLGTLGDNNRDMFSKGRGVDPPHIVGERHHKAKLTERQVRQIRQEEGRVSDLARRYDVTVATVCKIKKRQTWRRVK